MELLHFIHGVDVLDTSSPFLRPATQDVVSSFGFSPCTISLSKYKKLKINWLRNYSFFMLCIDLVTSYSCWFGSALFSWDF